MRTSAINYVIVGVFVLAAIVGIVGTLALLTGRTGATDSYYTIYDNVGGVKFGTPVLFEGYTVGQVEDVEPLITDEGTRFRVEMSVQEDWPIPEDSSADVVTSGFLGGMMINITGGDSPVTLEPGSRIPGRSPTNLFTALSDIAGQFQTMSEETLTPLLQNINRTVEAVNGPLAEQAPDILREVQKITEEMARRTPELMGNLAEAARNLNEELLSQENITSLNNTIRNVESTSADMDTLGTELLEMRREIGGVIAEVDSLVGDNSEEVDAALSDLRYTMGTIARDIDNITYNLEVTSRNMLEFSQTIRQNPSLILRGREAGESGPGTFQ
ncbi:MlaD family protein [Caenispirillum salinarum]|uniref:MlaD family protein n=1 Tax=Caenispirillum salinarum TaxID=859058 RepID=UPI00384B1CA3